MSCSRAFAVLVLANLVSAARAQTTDLDDYMTVGTRVAALIAQRRLASPPLPELGRDDRHHFTPQVAYLTGGISWDFGKSQGVITDSSYVGKPQGWGGGLAYRSPTIGRFAFYAYGLYTRSSSNYEITFNSPYTPDLSIENSETISKAYGSGLSFLLLGDLDTFFALGAFGGGFYADAETNYDYNYASPPAPGYDTRYYHNWTSRDYGVTTGLQAKIRVYRFSIGAVAVYARDFSDRCMKMVSGAGTFACMSEVDNSFKALGVSAGFGGLSAGVYSKLVSKIAAYDINLKTFRASYTLSF